MAVAAHIVYREYGVLLVKVHLYGKVVEALCSKGGAEQQLGRASVDVAKHIEGVSVVAGLARDGAGLDNNLVGAEFVVLEEHELVLVGKVQRPLGVLGHAEVEGLDTLGRIVGAIVAGDEQFGTSESILYRIRVGDKDGLVAVGGEIC